MMGLMLQSIFIDQIIIFQTKGFVKLFLFYSMPQLKQTDSAIDFAGTQKNLFISPIQVFALKMRKHIFSSSL